jgi:hypothetical protein
MGFFPPEAEAIRLKLRHLKVAFLIMSRLLKPA